MTNGKAKWWYWLPGLALAAYTLESGRVWFGLSWVLVLAWAMFAHYRPGSPRRPSRLAACAFNWSAPVLVLAACIERAFHKDYWGVAFITIVFGFALVNAVFLEPSPQRTALFRALTGIFVVVSVAAIWKTVSP